MPKRKDGITCTAHNRQGNTCGNPPIRGGTVCKFHGGAAPQVIKSARRRLDDLVDPAITELRTIIDDISTPAAVRLAAIRDVLDRAGYKSPIQVEVISRDTLEREYERLVAEHDSQP